MPGYLNNLSSSGSDVTFGSILTVVFVEDVGVRKISWPMAALGPSCGEFDLDLGAEGAGDFLSVGKDTRS